MLWREGRKTAKVLGREHGCCVHSKRSGAVLQGKAVGDEAIGVRKWCRVSNHGRQDDAGTDVDAGTIVNGISPPHTLLPTLHHS